MKVFIVTIFDEHDGSYGPVAAFSSLEKANAFVEAKPEPNRVDYSVVELEVDEA